MNVELGFGLGRLFLPGCCVMACWVPGYFSRPSNCHVESVKKGRERRLKKSMYLQTRLASFPKPKVSRIAASRRLLEAPKNSFSLQAPILNAFLNIRLSPLLLLSTISIFIPSLSYKIPAGSERYTYTPPDAYACLVQLCEHVVEVQLRCASRDTVKATLSFPTMLQCKGLPHLIDAPCPTKILMLNSGLMVYAMRNCT